MDEADLALLPLAEEQPTLRSEETTGELEVAANPTTRTISGRYNPFGLVKVQSIKSAATREGSFWGSQTSEESEPMALEDAGPPMPEGYVEVNRPGVLPTMLVTSIWAIAASAVLFAFVYIYAYHEVTRLEELGTQAAVAYAWVATAETLAPAIGAVKAVDAAVYGGIVTGVSDYSAFHRLMEQHLLAIGKFKTEEAIAQIEIVDAPFEPEAGSLLAEHAQLGGTELRTDRQDCTRIEGYRGCVAQPFFAKNSSWYSKGWNMGAAEPNTPSTRGIWFGPAYRHSEPHEVICEELCFKPTIAYVGRVTSIRKADPPRPQLPPQLPGSWPGASPPPAAGLLVRAAMDVDLLRWLCMRAGELTRGDVVLTTVTGDLLAAADMAWTVDLDPVNGTMRQGKVWELARPWASAVDPGFLRKARGAQTYKSTGGWRVSAWKWDGLPGDMLELEGILRVVVAVHGDAFIDRLVGPFVMVSLVASASPICIVGVLTFGMLFKKCCCGGGDQGDQGNEEDEATKT
jgi:hypothetical protein